MKNYNLIRQDLVYPELSYQIVGALFDVYNELGGGYREKYYQKAVANALKNGNLMFKEQVHIPLKFNGQTIGKNFLDFLIENKIVLEIKSGEIFTRKNIEQVYSYLKAKELKLGILANFTRSGLRFKRIINVKNSHISADS